MTTAIDIKKGTNELQVTIVPRQGENATVKLSSHGMLLAEARPLPKNGESVLTLRLNLPFPAGRAFLNVENAGLVAVHAGRGKNGRLPPAIRAFVDAAIMVAYAPARQLGKFEINGYRFAVHDSLGLAGLKNPTPARIVKATNEIEVGLGEFAKLEVQERILVLLHEFSHGYLNEDYDDEKEADYNALRLYAFAFMPIGKTQIVEALAEEIMPAARVRDALKIIEQIEL